MELPAGTVPYSGVQYPVVNSAKVDAQGQQNGQKSTQLRQEINQLIKLCSLNQGTSNSLPIAAQLEAK